MENRNITFTPILLALGLLAQMVQAVVPAPDGGYPNFTTAEGTKALQSLTTGSANTAVGWFSLFSNAGGSFNTATGAGSLLFNTADDNTAFGVAALLFNTTGINNTAVGTTALLHNTIAEGNTAIGAFALSSNTEGDFNTATGEFALAGNTTGVRNTATGDSALFSNTTGNRNTATGNAALVVNATGDQNTATGASALSSNTTGNFNTAIGDSALVLNNTGRQNTATGSAALSNNTTGFFNTATGVGALSSNITGGNNLALGFNAGNNVTTANNVIAIGTGGANVSDSCYIGSIFGVILSGNDATGVFIRSDGKLGTATSSRRFKEEIKPMERVSEALFALKPVAFRYKKEIDPAGTSQFGLIAEEVEKVNPDLVVRDKEGRPYSVRYEQVNAMLLNEFLKEHRKIEAQQSKIDKQEANMTELKSIIAQQQEGMEVLATRLKEQALQIQKVSAQIGVSKPASKVAAINP